MFTIFFANYMLSALYNFIIADMLITVSLLLNKIILLHHDTEHKSNDLL